MVNQRRIAKIQEVFLVWVKARRIYYNRYFDLKRQLQYSQYEYPVEKRDQCKRFEKKKISVAIYVRYSIWHQSFRLRWIYQQRKALQIQ